MMNRVLGGFLLSDADEYSTSMYPIFSSLNKKFEVFELIDNNYIVEGVVCKKKNLSYL